MEINDGRLVNRVILASNEPALKLKRADAPEPIPEPGHGSGRLISFKFLACHTTSVCCRLRHLSWLVVEQSRRRYLTQVTPPIVAFYTSPMPTQSKQRPLPSRESSVTTGKHYYLRFLHVGQDAYDLTPKPHV